MAGAGRKSLLVDWEQGLQRASLKAYLPKYVDVRDGAGEEQTPPGLQQHSYIRDYSPLPAASSFLTIFKSNKTWVVQLYRNRQSYRD